MSQDEIKQIVRKFDVDGSGGLDYNEFMKLLGFTASTSSTTSDRDRQSSQSLSQQSSMKKSSIDDVIDKLRSEMELRLGSKTEAAKRLKDLFAKFDKNGDGKISEMELTMSLDDMRVSVLRNESFALF